MRRNAPFGSRFGAVFAFAVIFLLVATALRIALAFTYRASSDAGPAVLARAFAAGFVYDVAALAWVALPACLLTAVTPAFRPRGPGRAAAHAVFVLAVFGVLFAGLAEWLFFAEFGARFNFLAVDYLVYTREVAGNAWESYPIAPLVAVLLTASLAVWLPWRPSLSAAFGAAASKRARASVVAGSIAAAFVSFTAVGGTLARVSPNRYACELAKNGLYELFSAFRNNELAFEPFYASQPEPRAIARARRLLDQPTAPFASSDERALFRRVTPTTPERRWNVVLVVVESLSAQYLASFGGEPGLTPELDRIGAEGVIFDRLYATGTRTVRGLEALTLSVPPTPGQSIVRRPDNGGLYTIATPFQERGYDVRFHYGGFGFFDDMNAYFGGNGFTIVDRAALAPDEIHFANVWGVADEDLYARVLREADASQAAGTPFFSLVMTTSNHRPYTYPEGRVAIPSHTGRHGAVQYTDWAIGDFVRKARSRPWFDDTLFVFVADHCASSSGKTEIPVQKYRIPLILYAPGRLPAARVETLASQIDVAPTILGLLRFAYAGPFFGRDLFAPVSGTPRAFLATYSRLALLERGALTVLSPGREIDAFRVDLQRGTERAGRPDPESVADAIAYYQTASWAWSHGRLRRHDADGGGGMRSGSSAGTRSITPLAASPAAISRR